MTASSDISASSTPLSPRKNVSFSEDAEAAAKRLLDKFRMTDVLDVAKLGMAFAIREGITTKRRAELVGLKGTNYNVGSIDPGGEIRRLLAALYPDLTEDPYRVLETLMNEGVLELDRRVARADILTLRDLLE